MSAEPYLPIACAFHEHLEFSVLRRSWLRLVYRLGQDQHDLPILPTDVATRDGAEWLSYIDEAGNSGVVRLDWIVSAKPLADS
jgi:Rho-binding antiterminator